MKEIIAEELAAERRVGLICMVPMSEHTNLQMIVYLIVGPAPRVPEEPRLEVRGWGVFTTIYSKQKYFGSSVCMFCFLEKTKFDTI